MSFCDGVGAFCRRPSCWDAGAAVIGFCFGLFLGAVWIQEDESLSHKDPQFWGTALVVAAFLVLLLRISDSVDECRNNPVEVKSCQV